MEIGSKTSKTFWKFFLLRCIAMMMWPNLLLYKYQEWPSNTQPLCWSHGAKQIQMSTLVQNIFRINIKSDLQINIKSDLQTTSWSNCPFQPLYLKLIQNISFEYFPSPWTLFKNWERQDWHQIAIPKYFTLAWSMKTIPWITLWFMIPFFDTENFQMMLISMSKLSGCLNSSEYLFMISLPANTSERDHHCGQHCSKVCQLVSGYGKNYSNNKISIL